MTRRNRQDLAPSLFPFLAVLVCTLGTLILLLALVAQDAATVAEQKARDELSEQTAVVDHDRVTQAQAVAMIDEAAFRIGAIEKIRDKQAAALEERRDQLTHLEDHIDRLKKNLDRLNAEMVSATRQGQTNTIDSSTIAMLKDQITEEQLAIEELKEKKGNETPRVVIVPHKGPNGTTRRPIYVECTSEGLTIWPEGVKIAIDHLTSRRSRLANPLDAALRVARIHAMKVYGDADPPYPLLVVRPHGTDAYFHAIAAMEDWDDQYGYEMLDSGIELAFNGPDPNLKKRMEESIRQAILRQSDQRTTKVVPLSASQLSREGNSRGFYEQPNHGYGTGNRTGSNNLAQQTNRLDDIYRQAAQELRSRDGLASEAGTEMNVGRNGESTGLEMPAGDSNDEPDSNSIAGQAEQSEQGPLQESGVTSGTAVTPGNGRDQQQARPRSSDAAGTSQDVGDSRRQDGSQANAEQANAARTNAAGDRPPQSVHRDGDKWALPSHVAHATGIAIVRSIHVQFYDDRFVVPAWRSDAMQIIPIDGNLDRASLQLATVLRDRIDRWGVALDNGRWEPVMEVDIMDGNNGRLEQLSKLFKESGIEVRQRNPQ